MSRQAVLALLREREGDFVSGGEIGRRLGLSRAAVWKAVEGLRQDGYTVEAGRDWDTGWRPLPTP